MSLWPAFSALTLGLTLFAAPSAALVIHVPGDQPTIQAGINVAQPGDMVLVAPGTYSGAGNINLDFLGKNIVVVSAGGPAVTTIDVQGSGRAFHLQSNLPASARVEGFTIRNGNTSEEGGGILITKASPTVRNCIFTNNTALRGGGMAVLNLLPTGPVAQPTIDNCVFQANGNGGLLLYGSAGGTPIRNCTFTENIGRGVIIQAFGQNGGSGRFEECVIRANTGGGVLFMAGFTGGTFINCEITDHSTAEGGAGVRDVSFEGTPVFENCLFARNHSTNGNGGGALVTGDDGLRFTGCRFEENSARNGGGLLYGFTLGSAPEIPVSSCQFVNNTATETAGGLGFTPHRNSGSASATGNLFWNNSAGQRGGAVVLGGEFPTILGSSTLVGNSAPEGAGVYAPFTGGNRFTIDRTIIAFSSGGSAVACEIAAFAPNVVCSDFFGNVGGDWAGCIAGEFGVDGNIAADPQFCNATNGDFHLMETSPCAPAQSACGLIGAFDPTCGATPVQPATWGSIKATYQR
jgi:parallel beta-helix repeat protein